MNNEDARAQAKRTLAPYKAKADRRHARFQQRLAEREAWLAELDTSKECQADDRCMHPALDNGRCQRHQD